MMTPEHKKKHHPVNVNVGQRLKTLREKQGISQQDLADQIHVSQQQLWKYETGENAASPPVLHELSRIFETDISGFFPDLSEDDTTKPTRN